MSNDPGNVMDPLASRVAARFLALCAGSATPSFDKLLADKSKIEQTLGAAIKKLAPLADKVEDMSKKKYGYPGPDVFPHLKKMHEAAYLIFNPLRNILSDGAKELSGLETATFPAAVQAKNLLAAMKDFNKAWMALGQVLQDKNDDKDGEAEAVSHELAMAVTTLKTIFGQYIASR
jgi:hypothetical protein